MAKLEVFPFGISPDVTRKARTFRVPSQSRRCQVDLIQIDFNGERRPINPYIFGTSVLAFDECQKTNDPDCVNSGIRTNWGYGVWDADNNQPNPNAVVLAQQAGIKCLRFPGGCGSHKYNWKEAIGPLEDRPMFKFGVDEFLQLCNEIGAKPIIVLSDFEGTNEDLFDLIEYLNSPDTSSGWGKVRADNGHPEPYNVEWFEFGNESWHGDHISVRYMTPEHYAERYLDLRERIKTSYPDVKLGAVLQSGHGKCCLTDWDIRVLKAIGSNVDFIIWHCYTGRRLDGVTDDPEKIFGVLFEESGNLECRYANFLQMVYELIGKEVPVAFTEFNGSLAGYDYPYRHSLGNAVNIADMIRAFLLFGDKILCANYWNFVNEYWGMAYNSDPTDVSAPYHKRPNYCVFELFNGRFGTKLIPVQRMPSVQNFISFEEPRLIYQFSNDLDWIRTYSGSDVDIEMAPEYVKVSFVDAEETDTYRFLVKTTDIAVDPLKVYKFTGHVKTENLSATSHIRVSIEDMYGYNHTHYAVWLAAFNDLDEWTEVSCYFIVPSEVSGVHIAISMTSGFGIANGSLYVKDVRIYECGTIDMANPSLTAITSTNETEDKLYVMVVNRDLHQSRWGHIICDGFESDQVVSYSILKGKEVTATNEDFETNVTLDENSKALPFSSNVFTFRFPKHSVTFLELNKRGES